MISSKLGSLLLLVPLLRVRALLSASKRAKRLLTHPGTKRRLIWARKGIEAADGRRAFRDLSLWRVARPSVICSKLVVGQASSELLTESAGIHGGQRPSQALTRAVPLLLLQQGRE